MINIPYLRLAITYLNHAANLSQQDENAMADKIGHDWKNQEAYDADDGSVVDW